MWNAVRHGRESLNRVDGNCTYDVETDIPKSDYNKRSLYDSDICVAETCVCPSGWTGKTDWINLD